MLKIEEIKKGCGFADGYTCEMSFAGTYFLEHKENDNYRLVLDSIALNSDCEEVLYKQFLQEIIEGINDQFSTMDNNYLYSVKQDYSDIEVYYDYEIDETFNIHENIITAKEQAIKYVLDKMK